MEKAHRSPKNQAEFLMNEGRERLNDAMDIHDYLPAMCRWLVEFEWVPGEQNLSKAEVTEYGYSAWVESAPECYNDALNALVLLAVVRGDEQAELMLALDRDLAMQGESIYEAVSGLYLGVHFVLRKYGYIEKE